MSYQSHIKHTGRNEKNQRMRFHFMSLKTDILRSGRRFAMNLVIFSCSPRPENKSNTALMVDAFKNGAESAGSSLVEVYYLYRRNEWDNFKRVFEKSGDIIFAMPLFAECIPEVFMEFLECLEPKESDDRTKIGFILQGGFKEAHQLKAVESYFEEVPSYLNCDYSGTLVKGSTFALSLGSDHIRKEKLRTFFEMGGRYVKEGVFDRSAVSYFNTKDKHSYMFGVFSSPCLLIEKAAWKVITKINLAKEA